MSKMTVARLPSNQWYEDDYRQYHHHVSERKIEKPTKLNVDFDSRYREPCVQPTLPLGPGHQRWSRQWWHILWSNTVEDIRDAKYGRFGKRFCTHVFPLLSIATLFFMVVSLATYGSSFIRSANISCSPNGEVYFGEQSRLWQGTNVFSINLPVGTRSFTFAIAKLIDIIWDITVGRGGQALLAVVGYRVFTKALARIMETSSVSQDTFKALSLQDNTIYSTLVLTRDLFTNKGRRSKLILFWIILSTTFVLLAPTWLGAMTGYTAEIVPYITDRSGSLIPPSEFQPVIYIIHDGDRIGLSKDYKVSVPWKVSGTSFPTYETSRRRKGNETVSVYDCESTTIAGQGQWTPLQDEPSCALMWSVSNYTAQYGFHDQNVTNSIFFFPNSNIRLFSRTLNISAVVYWQRLVTDYYNDSVTRWKWNQVPNGGAYIEDGKNIFRTSSPLFFHNSSGTLYDLETFMQKGTCQQASEVKYKWGFTYILTYLFMATFLAWMVVTWGIYLDAYFNSQLDNNRRSIGVERAVLDLNLAMQQRLGSRDTTLYSNEQLYELVRRERMSYQDLPSDLLKPCRAVLIARWWQRFSFTGWLRKEKWWLLALCGFIGLVTFELFKWPWASVSSWLPITGILTVIIAGPKHRSRWVIFAISLLAGFSCQIVVAVVMHR